MKIHIDTSSFSFRFIGFLLLLLAIFLLLCVCKVAGLVAIVFAILFAIQRESYLILKKRGKVFQNVENTLKSLGLEYRQAAGGFSTKTVQIKVINGYLFSVLKFKYDKGYNVQGKYLRNVVVKYQRYK